MLSLNFKPIRFFFGPIVIYVIYQLSISRRETGELAMEM